MTRHGETFKQQNKEQIDAILTPLREQIVGFQQGLQNAHIESAKERAQLAQQLVDLRAASSTMSTETRNLTQALKGEAQTQGAWGETILSTILQKSGLREGEEYVTQVPIRPNRLEMQCLQRNGEWNLYCGRPA